MSFESGKAAKYDPNKFQDTLTRFYTLCAEILN